MADLATMLAAALAPYARPPRDAREALEAYGGPERRRASGLAERVEREPGRRRATADRIRRYRRGAVKRQSPEFLGRLGDALGQRFPRADVDAMRRRGMQVTIEARIVVKTGKEGAIADDRTRRTTFELNGVSGILDTWEEGDDDRAAREFEDACGNEIFGAAVEFPDVTYLRIDPR